MFFFIFHQSGLRGNFPSLAHLVSRFVPSLTPNLFDKNHKGSISVIKNHAQANIFIAMVKKSKSFVESILSTVTLMYSYLTDKLPNRARWESPILIKSVHKLFNLRCVNEKLTACNPSPLVFVLAQGVRG